MNDDDDDRSKEIDYCWPKAEQSNRIAVCSRKLFTFPHFYTLKSPSTLYITLPALFSE